MLLPSVGGPFHSSRSEAVPKDAPRIPQSPTGGKPSRDASGVFQASKWAPLKEALARIYAAVGSRDIACLDLQRDLSSGRLPSLARWISYRTNEETRERLKPSAWKGAQIDAGMWPEYGQARVRGVPPKGDGGMFYVSRDALDRLYPLPEATRAPTPLTLALKQEQAPPPRKRGPANTHDWHTVCGTIARYCIDEGGQLSIPEKESRIVQAVLSEYDETDRSISETEVRVAVQKVCAELRKGPKPLEKPRARHVVRKLR